MKVTYLTRQEWGADTALPRLGHIVSPDERTEVFIHHTVAVDSDASPNIWETMAEVISWMRRLQTIRPDLGKDVPYNFVAFFMPNELVICEGRGANRSGAHTIGHNRSAIGLAVHGNFQLPTFGLEGYVKTMGPWLYQLKVSLLPFLGTKHPPGRDVYGHRDSGAQTACPGNHLYARLDDIVIEPGEEDFMAGLSDQKQQEIYDWLDSINEETHKLRDRVATIRGLMKDGDGSLRLTPAQQTIIDKLDAIKVKLDAHDHH